MPMRRARHRVAAVHRLFGRCCRATVERIRRESDHQQCQQHWFCEAHFSQVRRIQRPGQAKRSEEHTSELQSHSDLVCRLLLEKKKKKTSSWTLHATC